MNKSKTRRGVWAVVMRVFGDGSALVRAGGGPDEGQDIALGVGQLPPDPQPGEAGRLVREKGRMLFQRNEVDPVVAGFVWKPGLRMTLPDGTEMLIDGWGPPDEPPADDRE